MDKIAKLRYIANFSICLLCIGSMAFSAVAENKLASQSLNLTLDELLSIPEITQVVSSSTGSIGWVERQYSGWNAYRALAPNYLPEKLTDFSQDDGQELFLIGFSDDDALLIRRGSWGLNPDLLPQEPNVEMLALGGQQNKDKTKVKTKVLLPETWSAAPAFSHNNEKIFVATGGKVMVYGANLASPPTSLFSIRGVVKSLIPSPDGSKLAFTVDRSNLKRGKYGFVGIYDLAAKKLSYKAAGLGVDQDVVWSPSGDRIAFLRLGFEPRTWRFSDHKEGVPFDIIVASASSDHFETVFRSEIGYGSRFNGFSASGYSGLGGVNNLLWQQNGTLVFPYEKTGWKMLYSVDVESKEVKQLTKGKFEIAGMASTPDLSAIYYWSNTEKDLSRLKLFRLDNDSGKAISVTLPLDANMISGAGTHPQAVFPLTKERFVAIIVGATSPTRLSIFNTNDPEIQLSTGPNSDHLITHKMPKPEMVSFEAPDGTIIEAVLYRPNESQQGDHHGAVVWVHGGSRLKVYPAWDSSHARDLTWFYLLSKGYHILIPNYRSGIGYGLDFREPASYGGRGAGEVQDFVAAAKFLKAQVKNIDPEKIAIAGVSYGGHIVSNVLARTEEFKAGISIAGVGDWVVEMEKDFKESLQFNIPQRMKLEQLAYDSSAISVIDHWGNEPLLLVHGDNDKSAAMQQSLELYLALLRRGKRPEALVFPEEAHQFKKTEHIAVFLHTVERFLQQQVLEAE